MWARRSRAFGRAEPGTKFRPHELMFARHDARREDRCARGGARRDPARLARVRGSGAFLARRDLPEPRAGAPLRVRVRPATVGVRDRRALVAPAGAIGLLWKLEAAVGITSSPALVISIKLV